MRLVALASLSFALLWAIGCSPKESASLTPGKAPAEVKNESEAPAPEVGSTPSKATAPSEIKATKGVNPVPTVPKDLSKGAPAAKPSEAWRPASDLLPADAAKKIDQRLASLSGVKVQIHYELKNAAGSGFGDPTLKIKSPKVFSFAFPTLQKGVLLGGLAKADGKTLVQKVGSSVAKRDLNQAPAARAPAQVELAWTSNPGREVLGGYLDGRNTFAELVKSLPKQGYAITIQKRTLTDLPNHIQYMLRAERPGTSKAGKSLIEVIMDGRLFVPMSFMVQTSKPHPAGDSVFIWRAGWLNKQDFNDKEFNPKVLAG